MCKFIDRDCGKSGEDVPKKLLKNSPEDYWQLRSHLQNVYKTKRCIVIAIHLFHLQLFLRK